MKRCVFPLLILFCLAVTAQAALAQAPAKRAVKERPDWGKYFSDAGVTGTIVVMKDGSGEAMAWNPARAGERFLPASTFKVLNSLVALETGVATGPDMVFPWDGTVYDIKEWNKNLTLKEAFAASCVPVYQRIAREVGEERMARWVKAAGYGNGNIGGKIDTFWLEGDLRISALEQVDFLSRLYHGALPFSEKTMDTVKDIMVADKGEGQGGHWVLRAKTGWAARAKPQVGWWVGWVEKGGEVWFFAINLAITDPAQLKYRQGIATAVLKAEGLLP